MNAVKRHMKGILSLFIGMRVTMVHLFKKPVTLQYPDETWDLPVGAKGKLFNVIDECIGCMRCARVCPVDCIAIEVIKAGKDVDLGETTTGHAKKLHVLRFDIDFAKCCFCSLCVDPCPTECLTMTTEYENSVYGRNSLIHHYADMSDEKAASLREEAGGKSITVGIHP